MKRLDAVNARRIRAVAHEIPSGAKVLDVGFGNAELPGFIGDESALWRGFEKRGDLVAKARARGLDAYRHDAIVRWPEDDDCFGSVVLLNVLEHVEFPAFVLREAKRVVKPSGKVVAVVPYGLNLRKLYYELKADPVEEEQSFNSDGLGEKDLYCFSLNEVRFLFLTADLHRITIKRICGWRHLLVTATKEAKK